MTFTYLSAPYSHPDKAVVARRMEQFCKIDAKLMAVGYKTISPLYKHFMLQYSDLPGDWEYWQHYSRDMLDACKEMVVIMLDDYWNKSTGVLAEIEYCEQKKIPVRYFCIIKDEPVEIIYNNPLVRSDGYTIKQPAPF